MLTSRFNSSSVWSEETAISFSPRPRLFRWLRLLAGVDGDASAGDGAGSNRGLLLSETT